MKNYISLIILLQIFNFSYPTDKLVFLYTHFRHGARGPTSIKEGFTDNIGQNWTEIGQLTGVGERMHYLLGLRNRKKYIEEEKFLSEKFDPHQMLIYSTDVNRTIVSCSSQLQGWYPQRANLGEVLNDIQEANAFPPILAENKDDYIKNATKELNNSALPYRMILAPIRMISENEKFMNLHDIGTCEEKIDNLRKRNAKNNKEFVEYIKNFNNKYGKDLNKYYKQKKDEFTYKKLKRICSDFICDYTADRSMTEFKNKTGFNLTVFKDVCFEYYDMYYKYVYHGDEDKIFAHVESSKLMKELLFYMKRRLDANMTEIDEDANYLDYSIPKMLMISGHDTSLSADFMLLIKALGLNDITIVY